MRTFRSDVSLFRSRLPQHQTLSVSFREGGGLKAYSLEESGFKGSRGGLQEQGKSGNFPTGPSDLLRGTIDYWVTPLSI